MNTRNRLINFRVTDEEFRRLKTASTQRNARCLSDFARSAILETARGTNGAPEPADAVTSQLQAFDRRLARLESNLSRLLDVFAEVKPLRGDAEFVTMKSEG